MVSVVPSATKGLVSVFTGNGKGKTTAALGVVFRALGHGKRVCFIQFIKGKWKTGEALFANSIPGMLHFHTMGRGFTWSSNDLDQDKKLARDAWNFAVSEIEKNIYDLIVLDELTYLIHYTFISEKDVLDALMKKPSSLHIIVTGRHATRGLIDAADLVTEMNIVKHPYSSGIKAQKGIDY